ncbi:MAG: AI-2E family transporter [Verrucomicrobia bacterium]|nr:AI-2E family transporter [Verrucomicrobiota bacterium]
MNDRNTKPAMAPVANDWGARSHVRTLVLMAATAVGIYLCYRLALPFLPAFAWALALAVLFGPFHRRLESKTSYPSLAAAASVLIVGLILVVPATFVGQQLIQESAKGAELIKTKVESGEWRRALEAQPRLAPLAGWIERQIDVTGATQTLSNWLTATGALFVKGSVVQVMGLLLTFYLLFFFLRDRRAALQLLRSLSPLSEAEMDRLFGRVGDTIYATVYGTLAVSAVQGLLGGLMFWWLGLPAPLLWGVVMALLAVVPVLGAFVVWIPAALFLALEGSWVKALILTIWGAAVVGTIDNLLRPILVGKRLKLHTILAFISVVGGLILFGPAGLILGPVALTVTIVLLEIWRSRTVADGTARAEAEELSRSESERGPEFLEPAIPFPLQPESSDPQRLWQREGGAGVCQSAPRVRFAHRQTRLLGGRRSPCR